MYRFLLRPRWIAFHLLVAFGVVVMINLGFWQLHRLDQRRQFNAELIERTEQAPVAFGEIVAELDDGTATDADVEWRRVTMSGTYSDDVIVEFNQSQNGAAGQNILGAFEFADGSTVIVNRGFTFLGAEPPRPPSGPVDIVGIVRTTQTRRRGELTDAAQGPLTEVRRIDVERLAPQLDGDVAPVYVQLTESRPPERDLAAVSLPELSEGPHLSYAIQWFLFAALAVVGWVLAIRRSVTLRRRDERRAADAEAATAPG